MVRFAAVGLNHNHIYGLVDALLNGGGELACFFAPEAELAAEFGGRVPTARRARELREVLEDPSIKLVASAGISDERGPLGISVLRHGKDFLSDKPAFTRLDTLEEARRVQGET